MTQDQIPVRPCTTLEEFGCCVDLQRTIWGFNEADLVSREVFVVAAKIGGQVFGAYEGRRMVGFLLAFPGYREGRAYLHSHMTAVQAEYRDRGIGRRLKFLQREDALARGIDLVEWTFDPLELKNAFFNIERLGAIVRHYVPNQYGRTTSPLHAGLPTDRLVAEWWLRSPRVEQALQGKPQRPGADCRRVVIPNSVNELRTTNTPAAESIQTQAREEFLQWFNRGYAVTGFERGKESGSYLLEQLPHED